MGFIKKLLAVFGIKKHHTYYNYENDLSDEETEQQQQKIEALLRGTGRKGVDKVLAYMTKNDFYHVPSSVHQHHNYRGGLAQHVLSVYNLIKESDPTLPDDSVAIVAILHDLCKADVYRYQKDGGLRRNHGKSHRRGLKSIKILQECGFELTESERLAIRWHMGGNNAEQAELEESNRARRDPLAKALYQCNRNDSAAHSH